MKLASIRTLVLAAASVAAVVPPVLATAPFVGWGNHECNCTTSPSPGRKIADDHSVNVIEPLSGAKVDEDVDPGEFPEPATTPDPMKAGTCYTVRYDFECEEGWLGGWSCECVGRTTVESEC